MASSSLWQRFQKYFLEYRELGLSLDIRRMKFPDDLFDKMRRQIEYAFMAMGESDPEEVFHLVRLASNDSWISLAPGDEAVDDRFSFEQSP